MDLLAWLWWVLASGLGLIWSVVWFLISGWVSTLLQLTLLVVLVYVLKYGWQRAPVVLWNRTRSLAAFAWNWVRARDPGTGPNVEVREIIRVVRAKELGDVNLSTLLSVITLAGLFLLSRL